MAGNTNRNSLETILQFENRDMVRMVVNIHRLKKNWFLYPLWTSFTKHVFVNAFVSWVVYIWSSQWSVIWSTAQIPGMDNATGTSGPRRRTVGRRRLRIGSLMLGSMLTMHCRISASALTGGCVVFMIFLMLAIAGLANPMRHFEVYLGQWSISGPGRAFRIIPMLDGIGIAICINALVRAITCCTVAAISAIYLVHSLADAKLPFTYCRDFDLKTYAPIMKDLKTVRLQESRFLMEAGDLGEYEETIATTTVGLNPHAWRNVSHFGDEFLRSRKVRQIAMCLETYGGVYPALYSTPAYNFFYVEVVHLRSDYGLGQFNITLILYIICVWATLWLLLIMERLRYGKLIWNNVQIWCVAIPWIWVVCLSVTGAINLSYDHSSLGKEFRIGAKEVFAGIADAMEVALYIHSVSVGTELIHGKGLNHYASGHIDPLLNGENVWHSCLLLLLAAIHSVGAALCALVDYIHPHGEGVNHMRESTLWIIPMYSKCTSIVGYSHLMSTLIFGGLLFSYMAVAFILLKTALHTIFEYRVKLVFVEQMVVAVLMLTCIGLSLIFATNGGIALLESVDSLMTGVAVSFVCCLELGGLLFVYHSPDFMSDMNVAMEDNACSSRIGAQWTILPFLSLGTLMMKIVLLLNAEFPKMSMYMAIAPLAGVAAAVPLRAAHNAYVFLRPAPRRGT